MGTNIKDGSLSKQIASIAVRAMLYEVLITPKPGLVDLLDNGSHWDMDYKLFINSAFSLEEYFKSVFELGFSKNRDFDLLRKYGIEAEKKMYKVTRGVNTHKGAIFSLGLFVYATGFEWDDTFINLGKIVARISKTTRGISLELKEDSTSNGVEQYRKYGFKGIREEAEKGFNLALAGLEYFDKQEGNFNDRAVNTLFYFMSMINDTTTLKRGGIKGLAFVKKESELILNLKGMNSERGRKSIYFLNKEMIKRNLTSGGSSDYLILTIYLNLLRNLW